MLRKIVIICVSLLLSTTAFASLAKSSGIYVEGNVGSDKDFDFAGSANVGYKINDYFAVEGGAATYSGDNDNDYLFDLAAKIMYPFSNGFNVFAKLGGAEAHGDSDYESVLFYGAGLSYAFTPNISGVFQWNSTTENNGVEAPDVFMIGLNYTF